MTGLAGRPSPVSPAAFAQLAAGGGGPDAVEQLASAQRPTHAALLAQIVSAAGTAGHPQRQWATEGLDLLALALRHDLAAAKQAVRHPSVGLWAR
jgi:HEXXH motif-containing protein